MGDRTWRIGALARETGLTVRTLHHYDAIGLVTPTARTSGGHRIYSESDVDRLYAVAVLRRMGMSTAADRRKSRGIVVELRAIARLQCGELDAELATLSALRQRVDTLLADGSHDPAELIRTMQQLPATPFAVGRALALLPYDDVLDAQARLVAMFAFEAGPVSRNADGTVAHAVVLAGTGFVHLHPPTKDIRPPGRDGIGSAAVVATVADTDRHSAHAATHGAELTYGPLDTSYGVREYGARDHAGHHWSFQSPLPKEQS